MAGLGDIFTALNNIAANLGKLIAQTSLSIIVPVTQGGTGATSLTAHAVLVGEGGNPVNPIGPGTTGQMLLGNTGADPSWGNNPAIIGGTINGLATTQFLSTAATIGATGLIASPLPLVDCKNSNGTPLAASASSGEFGISITLGTSEHLIGESATSNTKTDIAIVEVVLPPWYVATQNVTLTVSCQYNLGGSPSAIGTHTLAGAAYLTANNGTQGSSLIATSPQSVPVAAGDVTFTITGATLLPASRLILELTMVIQETGGGTAVGQVNSVRLS